MATREEYLDIAEQALREGDEATAISAMDEAEKLSSTKEEKSLISQAGDIALEGMAAVNRGAAGIVDFAATPVNAALQLAGADLRIPSAVQALAPATQGNFMEQGLGRDIVRGAGEAVPAALAVGGALRQAASALPAMGQASESIGAGALRQLGSTSAAQDAGFAALSGAGGAVGQEIGGDAGALIGSVAAPAAVAMAPQVAKAALKGIFGNPETGQASRIIDDFAAIGEVPTAGMASGKPSLQQAETVSSSVMGGGVLRKKSESIAANMQKRLAQIADDLSTKEGAEAAGLEIKKGIQGKGGFLDRFRSTSSVLWNKADSLIDDSKPVSMANTKSILDEIVRGDKVGAILDNPKLVQLKAVVDEAADIDYATLKSLRSSIGQKIGNNELVSDIPRAELKRVYGALTQDIKSAASESSPEALKAFERANKYTRTAHDRIDDYLERISTKVEPEKIFQAVAKGGEGTQTINAVKRSLKPEEWEVVASNVVRRMGRSTSGNQTAEGDAFSVDKFVTDWDKLGSAKKALFSGSPKLDSYGDDLAKIARVASTVKQSSRQGANYSGTAQAASRIAAGTGLATGVISASPTILGLTAGSIAMNTAGARLMSNPNFVKWLAQSAKIPAKNSAAAIGALSGVANQSSADDAAIIQQLVEELEDK